MGLYGGTASSDQQLQRNRRRTQGLAPGFQPLPPPPHSLHSINHKAQIIPTARLYLYFCINQTLTSFHADYCVTLFLKDLTTVAAHLDCINQNTQD